MDSAWERDLGAQINVRLCIICVEAGTGPWYLFFWALGSGTSTLSAWPWQDFWAVVEGCPVIAGYMFLFFCCLLIRKAEDWVTGVL